MDRTDAVKLVAFVASACPAMRLEDTTADAWLIVLGRYPLQDCLQAAANVIGREKFVAVSDLNAEVKAIRAARAEAEASRLALTRGEPADPPPEIRAIAAGFREKTQRAASAVAVPCPHCHASAGTPCSIPGGDGQRLQNLPAHHARLAAAGQPPIAKPRTGQERTNPDARPA